VSSFSDRVQAKMRENYAPKGASPEEADKYIYECVGTSALQAMILMQIGEDISQWLERR
jgi:hypothetical protein